MNDWKHEFLKLHYEPEHEPGGFCWCNPCKVARDGELHIEHNEQRKVLISFIEGLLTQTQPAAIGDAA